jgi:hypothetical protein
VCRSLEFSSQVPMQSHPRQPAEAGRAPGAPELESAVATPGGNRAASPRRNTLGHDVTLATGRTTVTQGVVHVVMFAAFLFLALVP